MSRRLGLNFVVALCLSLGVSPLLHAAAANSPVADAAMRGDRGAVRTLLKEGADVNAAQGDGMSALHWAAQRGDAELVSMLVYGGANAGAVTRIGQYTPLHLASTQGNVAVVEALLKAGADVKAKTTNTGATPLHMAAGSGSAEIMGLLLDRGADINAKESEWGQTPLIFAAAQNRVGAIRTLLKRGADPNVATKTVDVAKESALDRAAGQRAGKILESTVPKGEKPTATQLQAAIQAARELLLSGKLPSPDANAEGWGGRGDQNFNPEEINPPVAAKGGLTALHHAARQGHVDSVRALIDGGADVNNIGGGEQASALLTAVINGQFDAAMVLIEKGADPNLSAASNGVTPLWAAVNVQWQPRTRFPQPQELELQNATYLDVIEALLKAGADPNGRIKSHPWIMVYTGCGNRNCGLADTSGSTAFWRAAYLTDVDAMKLLVEYGADPNIPTMAPREPVRRGGGPPPPAATTGGPGQAAVVPGAGGAVPPIPTAGQERYNAPTIPFGGPGAFPLHAAAGVEYGEGFAGNAHRHAPDGWLPALKYLIEDLGADINARDNDGYTALHHAAARGDNDAILYLVSKGADVTAVARSGQTVADMANSPVQRLSPFTSTVALLEKLGSKNSHKCVVC